MRVQNGAVDSSFNTTRSDAAQSSAVEPRPNSNGVTSTNTDQVSLSNASSLVELAKGMMPADKQAKFQAVTAQVHAGQYNADASGISQAIVQGHSQG